MLWFIWDIFSSLKCYVGVIPSLLNEHSENMSNTLPKRSKWLAEISRAEALLQNKMWPLKMDEDGLTSDREQLSHKLTFHLSGYCMICCHLVVRRGDESQCWQFFFSRLGIHSAGSKASVITHRSAHISEAVWRKCLAETKEEINGPCSETEQTATASPQTSRSWRWSTPTVHFESLALNYGGKIFTSLWNAGNKLYFWSKIGTKTLTCVKEKEPMLSCTLQTLTSLRLFEYQACSRLEFEFSFSLSFHFTVFWHQLP